MAHMAHPCEPAIRLPHREADRSCLPRIPSRWWAAEDPAFLGADRDFVRRPAGDARWKRERTGEAVLRVKVTSPVPHGPNLPTVLDPVGERQSNTGRDLSVQHPEARTEPPSRPHPPPSPQ